VHGPRRIGQDGVWLPVIEDEDGIGIEGEAALVSAPRPLVILEDSVRVPHQAVIEFVAAVTRPIRGHVILKQSDALREAEECLKQFPVLYPNEAILRLAIRGCATYELNWFDAQIWAYAEHYGLQEILTEDLQHDRLYGSVRVVNPFLGLS
jgi:predicted nucleic acid-binding protein